jgi:hypothetical protein
MKATALMSCVLAWCAQAVMADDRPPRVSPSAAGVPDNLLRLSLVFDTPPSRPVLGEIELVGAGGVIAGAFLNQELRSPDGRAVTLLFHPGRVKTGLDANMAFGRPLEGEAVARLLWRGRELTSWKIQPADISPPDPRAWRVVGSPGEDGALMLELDAPIDSGAAGLIAIADTAGRRVDGHAELLFGEMTWRFRPSSRWTAGSYRVIAHPSLEDPSGNRVGQAFEHRASEAADPPAAGPGFQIP